MNSISITCDVCSAPAHVRIGGENLCRICAHAAIDAVAPAPISVSAAPRTDEDTFREISIAHAAKGRPVRQADVRQKLRSSWGWFAESVTRLERAGRIVRDARHFTLSPVTASA